MSMHIIPSSFKTSYSLKVSISQTFMSPILQHPIILPVVTQQMVSSWSPLTSRFKSLAKTSSSGTVWGLQVKYISVSPICSQVILRRNIFKFCLLRQQKIIKQSMSELIYIESLFPVICSSIVNQDYVKVIL